MPPDNANPTLQVQLAATVLPAGELEFAGHARQVAADVAPAVVEYVPAPQLVHATEPVVVLYVPVTQAVHGPPLGPVKPMLQVQLVFALQPLHDAPELTGQSIQESKSGAPSVVE